MAPSVVRTRRSFVPPCKLTPSGKLDLSSIDNIAVLRSYSNTLHVFKHGAPQAVRVIREAVSKALVPYYPLAGRLKDASKGQVQIECSGEGAWFVEAAAGYALDTVNYFDCADSLVPYDNLLPDQVPKVDGMEPLVQMQVTQFECGGFVIGLVFSHTVCDGLGSAQFIIALGEMARGLDRPSIAPVWHRDFFPPLPQADANLQAALAKPAKTMPNKLLCHVTIDVPVGEIKRVKEEFYDLTQGKFCSTFDVVAASFWIHRTRAVNLKPETGVGLVFFANCRDILDPPLPKGFYGNCVFPLTITASSEFITQASTVQVIKLIRIAKSHLPLELAKYKNGDHFKHGVDPYAPPVSYTTLHIAEWAGLGFNRVDYGWGPPVYMIPIPGSRYIPIGIMGLLPWPEKGIRLTTCCVEEAHRQSFLHFMKNPF